MNYPSLAKTASALIRSAGFQMTARRSVPGEYDPTQGKPADPTVQEWQFYGVKGSLGKLTKYAEFSGLTIDQVATLVQSGAALLIAEVVNGYVPRKGDTIYLPDGASGRWWTVEAADGLDPGGIDVIFNILVRA